MRLLDPVRDRIEIERMLGDYLKQYYGKYYDRLAFILWSDCAGCPYSWSERVILFIWSNCNVWQSTRWALVWASEIWKAPIGTRWSAPHVLGTSEWYEDAVLYSREGYYARIVFRKWVRDHAESRYKIAHRWERTVIL